MVENIEQRFYEFEVESKIKGKARPRVNTNTCQVYTPNSTKDYEELIRQNFKIRYPRYETLEGRIAVKIIAYFNIPKNTNKLNTSLMKEGKVSPTKKPDIDNIVKVILDALNKMAFKDDNQITKLEVEKIYGEEEKLFIHIEEY